MHELYFRFSGDVDLCNGMAVSGNDDDHSDGGDYEDGYGDSIWRSTAPQDVHRRRARTHCNRSGLQLLSNITFLPWRKSGSPIFKRVFRVADFCGNFGFADLQAVAKNVRKTQDSVSPIFMQSGKIQHDSSVCGSLNFVIC